LRKLGVRVCLSTLALFAASAVALFSQQGEDDGSPKLLSVFPSAAQRGTTVKAEIRGNSLAGARAIWFEAGLAGRILELAEISNEAKPAPAAANTGKARTKPRLYRASVEFELPASISAGRYPLRLISAGGVSNRLDFRVVDEAVTVEDSSPHPSAMRAQAISLPALINGRLDRPGQLDYYSFHAKQGERIAVRVLSASNMEPHIAFFGAGRSWFDPQRPGLLLTEEQRTSDLMPAGAKGTLVAQRDQVYFLELSSIFGKGSPDAQYLMRVQRDTQHPDEPPEDSGTIWSERAFDRKLEPGRMAMLGARSVPGKQLAPAPQAAGTGTSAVLALSSGLRNENAPDAAVLATLVTEREPNDSAADAQEIPLPAIIEGAIGRPGDIDNFRFKVKAGHTLVFEIQTPGLQPPYFNPRIGVVDASDHELFSNVHRRISLFNNNADRQVYLKAIEPKAAYRFETAGDYVLQVRDITSRYGGSDFRYRVLIRPQVPHIGEVTIGNIGSVNLVRGQAKTLKLTTAHEEGFSGEVAFSFVGLPLGVEAFPAAAPNDSRAPTDIDENADAVAAKLQTTTIVLMADSTAPLTPLPSLVEVYCRPVANGVPGPQLFVNKIPVMVVDAAGLHRDELVRLGR
jgi:hypothetical protein